MNDQAWLWKRPNLLVAGEWRLSEVAVPGVPSTRDGRQLMLSIYGEQQRFRDPDRIDALLRMVERRLDFDPETWRDQRAFFQQLFQHAFVETKEPGWLTVTRDRGDFAARVTSAGAAGSHRAVQRRRLFPLRMQGSGYARFGREMVPAGGLRMWYRAAVPSRELSWYEVTIERALRGDGMGAPIRTHENWMFLGNASHEERRLRARGVNPSLRDFGAARGAGEMAPLLSLCRLSTDRQWVQGFIASLAPKLGMVVDLRSAAYTMEWYCRSNACARQLLDDAQSPRRSERFAHG